MEGRMTVYGADADAARKRAAAAMDDVLQRREAK